MSDSFSPTPRDRRLAQLYGWIARIQGVISWSILIVVFATAFAAPRISAMLILAFLVFFLFRSAHHALFLAMGFLRFWIEEPSDWCKRIDDLVTGVCRAETGTSIRTRLRRRLHARTLAASSERGVHVSRVDVDELIHLLIVPIYRETREIIEPGIRALSRGEWNARTSVVLVLALEERSPDETKTAAWALTREYSTCFRQVLVTEHPYGVAGEIPGKASNESYAARTAREALLSRNVSVDRVIVTVLDADAVPHSGFLAALTYQYLAHPNPGRCLFQPIPVFDSNIWDVPGPVRIIEMMSTIFELVESTNVEGAVTFSSYSISLATLHEVGYWPPDVIAEDAAIYWRCYVAFGGDVRVIPVPSTISMDAVSSDGMVRTMRAAYMQKLRWAYGAELIPPVMWGTLKSRISVRRKIKPLMKLIDNNTSWATWPFLLTLGPWLPQLGMVLAADRPLSILSLEVLSPIIFSLTGGFLLIMVAISAFFVYRRRSSGRVLWKILHPFEWFLLLPVATVLLSGMPALHAQTLLMFGRRLSYVPVEKRR